MKRSLLILLLVSALLPKAAFADDASKRAKIEDLFAVLHLDQMSEQLMKAAMQSAQQLTGSPATDKLSDSDRTLISAYLDKVQQACHDTVGMNALKPVYVDMYSQTFSEDEVDGMLTFYKSPVGQSVLSKMPDLLRRATTVVQAKIPELQERLKELATDFQQQMAEAHRKQAASGKARS